MLSPELGILLRVVGFPAILLPRLEALHVVHKLPSRARDNTCSPHAVMAKTVGLRVDCILVVQTLEQAWAGEERAET